MYINHSFPRPFSSMRRLYRYSLKIMSTFSSLFDWCPLTRENYFLIFFRDGTLLTAPIDCLLLSSFVSEKIDYNTDEFIYIHIWRLKN